MVANIMKKVNMKNVCKRKFKENSIKQLNVYLHGSQKNTNK